MRAELQRCQHSTPARIRNRHTALDFSLSRGFRGFCRHTFSCSRDTLFSHQIAPETPRSPQPPPLPQLAVCVYWHRFHNALAHSHPHIFILCVCISPLRLFSKLCARQTFGAASAITYCTHTYISSARSPAARGRRLCGHSNGSSTSAAAASALYYWFI